MRVKTVAISGAGGLIGQCLVQYLIERTDVQVHACYSKQGTPHASLLANPSRCRIYHGDLCARYTWDSLLDEADCVVHLAQNVRTAYLNQPTYQDALMREAEPTNVLFEVLASINRPLHLIFPSSGGTVYDGRSVQQRPHRETDAPQPVSPYGVQKVAFEHFIRLICEVNKYVSANILRITNPYGIQLPKTRGQGFIGIALTNILTGHPVEIWGSPEATRDFIHIDDVSAAIFQATTYQNGSEVINIGSGVAVSLGAVLATLSRITSMNFPYKVVPSARPFLPNWNAVDITKAATLLNWRPSVSLTEGLRTALATARRAASEGNT